MIDSLLIDKLKESVEINNYCNGNMYVLSAPIGTPTPYIAVEVKEASEESNVVNLFNIKINVYDDNEDKRQTRAIGKKIINKLNYTQLNGDGYSAVRLIWQEVEVIREPESTLSRVFVLFFARGCEYIENN